jgi:3-deoxy-D-manno-octulosonate 8-phosphate phosphatase (KDO 8-P phosphatase)
MSNILAEFKKISTFVFDIDGVLTDGTILVLRDGLQARRMHVKDGFGLQMAMKSGYRVFIISGGYSDEVKSRLEKLGVKDVFLAVENKTELLSSLLKKNKINWDEVLYMGDDLPDLALMGKVGLSCCPADAVHEVKSVVKYISPVNGGWGCVRDVIEKVLKAGGKWEYDSSITSK